MPRLSSLTPKKAMVLEHKLYLPKVGHTARAAVGNQQLATRHCSAHPPARRRRSKFLPACGEAKLLRKQGLERRAGDAQVSLTKQQATAFELRADDHLRLNVFVSAQRLLAALKVFLRRNARAEPCGTRVRENEDEKRCPVRGSNVWLIEPEPMDTSPTSRPIEMMMRRPSECRPQLGRPVAAGSSTFQKKDDLGGNGGC